MNEQETVDKIIGERKVARRRKDNFVVWLFIWPLTTAASFAAMAALLNFIENEGIVNFGKTDGQLMATAVIVFFLSAFAAKKAGNLYRQAMNSAEEN